MKDRRNSNDRERGKQKIAKPFNAVSRVGLQRVRYRGKNRYKQNGNDLRKPRPKDRNRSVYHGGEQLLVTDIEIAAHVFFYGVDKSFFAEIFGILFVILFEARVVEPVGKLEYALFKIALFRRVRLSRFDREKRRQKNEYYKTKEETTEITAPKTGEAAMTITIFETRPNLSAKDLNPKSSISPIANSET